MSEEEKKAQNAGKTFTDTPGVGEGADKSGPGAAPTKDASTEKKG